MRMSKAEGGVLGELGGFRYFFSFAVYGDVFGHIKKF